MNENKNENINNFWINKKARIEILKDGKRLVYTAVIIEIDSLHLTFIDRDKNIFSFNRELVKEMQILNGGAQ
jgi:hypothetical protein